MNPSRRSNFRPHASHAMDERTAWLDSYLWHGLGNHHGVGLLRDDAPASHPRLLPGRRDYGRTFNERVNRCQAPRWLLGDVLGCVAPHNLSTSWWDSRKASGDKRREQACRKEMLLHRTLGCRKSA